MRRLRRDRPMLADSRHFASASLQALSFPLVAAAAAFGWRAMTLVGGVAATAVFTTWLWRRAAGGAIWPSLRQSLIAALTLACLLPSEWCGGVGESAGRRYPLWPLACVAGLSLGGIAALRERLRSTLLDPVVFTLVALIAAAGPAMLPEAVLPPGEAFRGDVRSAAARRGAWPADTLHLFAAGRLGGDYLTLDALVRDRLPPLEDVLLARVPAPLGLASPVAILVGGLLLCYRGTARWRVIAIMLASAYLAFLLIPISLDSQRGGYHAVTALAATRSLGLGAVLTFVHYQLLTGVIPFAAVFVATDGKLAPLNAGSQWIYAAIAGSLAAVLQRYVSPLAGPLAAVLVAAVIASPLERIIPRRPRVGATRGRP
jgi:Na+-transporting NADH:ubiquinone oxidoreductase subunit NqrB